MNIKITKVNKYFYSFISIFFIFPLIAIGAGVGSIQDLVLLSGRLISTATTIVFGLSVLAFFWGLTVFVFSAGDEKNLEKGKIL